MRRDWKNTRIALTFEGRTLLDLTIQDIAILKPIYGEVLTKFHTPEGSYVLTVTTPEKKGGGVPVTPPPPNTSPLKKQ
jgi:hypothetical protein